MILDLSACPVKGAYQWSVSFSDSVLRWPSFGSDFGRSLPRILCTLAQPAQGQAVAKLRSCENLNFYCIV